MTAIAVVGTGRMGAAMATRLRRAGREVVAYNRTRSRAAAVADRAVDSPREAAASADIVLVSLADDAALDAAYRGPDGLVAGLRPGAVVVETSTVRPDTVRALAPLVETAGATLLDAPVSGSVPVVERGELTFMVGGDPAALDRVRPVLDVLSARVFHLGGQGSGATMKLVVNSIICALNHALSEALVLAEKAGLARETVYDVFATSAIAAPFVHYKRSAFEHPEDTPVAFRLDLLAKDGALIAELADRSGARMDQLTASREVMNQALKAGYGDRDLSALAAFLRDQRA
jgi:3-hydroxyisobutyrate dehydrogenase-like beta-hydroxyacid dehydrogenase